MKTTAQRQLRIARIASSGVSAAVVVATVFMAALASAFSATAPNDCSVGQSGGIHCAGVVSRNGVHARLNSGRLQTSLDGATWTERPLAVRTFLRGISYGTGLFVAVGGSYFDEPGVIVTSRDGVTWTRRNRRHKQNLYSVAFGNGVFVSVGDAGTIFTSTDGIVWKPQRSAAADTLLATVVFGNGTFVAGGESGAVLTSTNGSHWQRASFSAPVFVGTIVFDADVFAARTSVGTFVSNDGLSWQPDRPVLAASSD